MFYHQDILQRRGGKFGTVWLAATKFDVLKRRDFSSVNIRRTCDDILDYILVRLMGKRPGTGQPRFSLYLSSQLMYGVVRIFKRQNEYLLDDITTFFCKMRIAVATLEEIDLKAGHRHDQLNLDLAEYDAENPWFGSLQMETGLLKSPQLPDLETWRVESSLSIPRSPMHSPPGSKVDLLRSPPGSKVDLLRSPQISITEPMLKPDIGSPHTVSSKEEITITIPEIDMTLFQDMQIPLEHDLPTFDGRQIESILEEPLPAELQMGKFLSPVKVPQYEEMQQDLAQGVLSPKEKTPMTKPDNGIPERRQHVLSPGVTPMPPPEQPALRPRRPRASITLQLAPVPPSPKRQRKRRHLCIDANIQIHKDQLKENFRDREDILRPFVLPDLKSSSVQDLFSNPGQKAFAKNPKLLQLWRRNAVYGILETESDIETPAWSVPNLQSDGVSRSTSDEGSRRSHSDEESRPRSKRRLVEAVPPQLSPVFQQPELEVILEQPMTEQQSIEMVREASISMEKSRISIDTPVSIHQRSVMSDADRSRDTDRSKGEPVPKKLRRSRTRGSVSTEEELEINLIHDVMDNQSLRESLGHLSSVIEEKDIPQTPVPIVTTTPTPTGRELLRLIHQYTQDEESTTFHELCPTNKYDRCQAAQIFADLLDLCHGRIVKTEQEVPYGDIYIWRR